MSRRIREGRIEPLLKREDNPGELLLLKCSGSCRTKGIDTRQSLHDAGWRMFVNQFGGWVYCPKCPDPKPEDPF